MKPGCPTTISIKKYLFAIVRQKSIKDAELLNDVN
jgi:hypothetical protein